MSAWLTSSAGSRRPVVTEAQGDAAAEADHRLVPVQLKGHRSRVDHAARHLRHLRRFHPFLKQHGELVPAQAGEHVARAQAAGNPLHHPFQQHVAQLVPERVVHFLEVVEVEDHHRGEPVALRQRRAVVVRAAFAAQAGQGVLQPRVEAGAVGQAGQLVKQRHAPDLRLRLAPLRHVVEGGDPAAAHRRLMVDGVDTAVAQRHLRVDNPVADLDAAAPKRILLRRHAWAGPGGIAQVHHVAQRHAEAELAGFQVIHLRIAAVEQHQALLLVEHAQALPDAVQREVAQLQLTEQGQHVGGPCLAGASPRHGMRRGPIQG